MKAVIHLTDTASPGKIENGEFLYPTVCGLHVSPDNIDKRNKGRYVGVTCPQCLQPSATGLRKQ